PQAVFTPNFSHSLRELRPLRSARDKSLANHTNQRAKHSVFKNSSPKQLDKYSLELPSTLRNSVFAINSKSFTPRKSRLRGSKPETGFEGQPYENVR
ncbi:hypothetical protein OE996_RS25225, partial [Escherichia coli]